MHDVHWHCSMCLTLISPLPFPLNVDIIDIHEHNLHMIIVFVFFFLFLNEAWTSVFATISDLHFQYLF